MHWQRLMTWSESCGIFSFQSRHSGSNTWNQPLLLETECISLWLQWPELKKMENRVHSGLEIVKSSLVLKYKRHEHTVTTTRPPLAKVAQVSELMGLQEPTTWKKWTEWELSVWNGDRRRDSKRFTWTQRYSASPVLLRHPCIWSGKRSQSFVEALTSGAKCCYRFRKGMCRKAGEQHAILFISFVH